ncbi:MAG: AI-2E family transporter [Nanoarchaeota archaeon]|nr:AI-2E family transporter [Nanoarchaeota archaeon]
MAMKMDEDYFKKVMTAILFILLIVLSFFVIKPILISIIFGVILAFVFTPVYNKIYKITKNKNFSVSIISFFLVLIIILLFWFLTPIIIEQSLKIFVASQQMDIITPLKQIFPHLFTSEAFSTQIVATIHAFITKTTNSLMNQFTDILLNLPTLSLQLVVVAFTFFFVLRDKEELISYIKSLLPFPEEVERKLFESTKGLTTSIIYGQILIGILQGIIAGVGFFIFGVPNALLLTILATVGGVLPMIGPVMVWVPVDVYLFVAGNQFEAMGVLIFGLISSTIDNILRPIIVSRATKMSSSLVLIGMIGGLFLFGILGLILGPLILAYLLIVLELYRKKKSPEVFIQEPVK